MLEGLAKPVILTGSHVFRSHPALGFVLAFEPEIVFPQLSFERGSALLRSAAAIVAPAFDRFVLADRAERLGEWVARLALSYLLDPCERVRLDDTAHVRALVVNHILPSVTRTNSTFASVNTGEGASQ